jgi:hypothetical protein
VPPHEVDALSLVAGVAFGGTALVFLAERQLDWSGRWVWPILLIVIGVVGLALSRARSRHAHAAAAGKDDRF